jgi:hypothetical protein
MGHAITFFALNSQDFAHQMRNSEQELLDRIVQLVRRRSEGKPPDEHLESELPILLDAARRLCQNSVPHDCRHEYFYALCWLADVATERVVIGPFQKFSKFSYITEIGIWPWLLRTHPPFAVPVCREPPPQVGFLSSQDMQSWTLASLNDLPPNNDREVNKARQDFRDVLESLLADQLDLLAVLI